MPFAVENLKLYQKAADFADQVLTPTECFRREDRFLADQLNRASISIATSVGLWPRPGDAVSPVFQPSVDPSELPM